MRTTATDQPIQFYGDWGRGIRNGFGLWRGNEKLPAAAGDRLPGSLTAPAAAIRR